MTLQVTTYGPVISLSKDCAPADAPSSQPDTAPTYDTAQSTAGTSGAAAEVTEAPSSSEGGASTGSDASTSSVVEVQWSEPKEWQNVPAELREYLDSVDQKTKRVLQLLIQYGHQVKHLYPKTHEDFADIQARIQRLLGEGEVFQALPLQSMMAFMRFLHWGPEHPTALAALHDVVSNLNQRGHAQPLFFEYLLPLAVKHWGIESPETKRLVQQAAVHVYKLGDPRQHPYFTRTVQDIAQRLPDGLGWGKVEVGPVPDEEAFNRHAVMQRKAEDLVSKREYKLAQTMAERCVKFYDTLGSHWLAMPRKVSCTQLLGGCALYIEDAPAAEPFLAKAKRLAQRELGANHEITLESMWQFALILMAQNRVEQALSMFSKALRVRKEVLGPRHYQVIENQVG